MASESDYQPTSSPLESTGSQKAATLRFGRYEVARREDGRPFELGRGGMGVTYKAVDPELRRAVVLKVISPMLLGNDPQARARFQREARSAAGVHHPHIATIFDIGEERGEDYYVMEFIEGEDLLTRIKRDGPLDALSVLRIARQVAEALDAAWQQGIVHRDIKPANLMVARRPAAREAREGPLVKVVDFGLAKALKVAGASSDDPNISSMLTGAAQAVFSPSYASPEQIEDEELDIRSDLYSLGITLWQLLTGSPTFGNTSKQRTIVGHLSKEPPFEELRAVHVPEGFIALLGKLLEKAPADRPATPEVALDEIDLLLGGGAAVEPTRSPDPGPSRVQPPPQAQPVADYSFPLVEVLRCRGALPIGEVLLLLDALAPQVDAMRQENPSAMPNLDPAYVLVQIDAPPADANELPARPLGSWPDFALRLSGAAEAAAQQTPDQTMLPSNSRGQFEDAIQAVGTLVYELLDGKPPPRVRYRPLGAINEDANAVLRRSLEGEAGFPTAAEFTQALRTALEILPSPVYRETPLIRREAPPRQTFPAPPVRQESVSTPVRREAPPRQETPIAPVREVRREAPPPRQAIPAAPDFATADLSGGQAIPPGPKRGPALLLAGAGAVGLVLLLVLLLVFWPKSRDSQEKQADAGKPPERQAEKPTPAPNPALAQQARINRLLDEADNAYFASDWKKTVEKCTETLALAPDSLSAYARRGWAYSRSGDAQRAAEDWNKAVAIPPQQSARSYNGRGLAYDGLGQKDKTLADYNKAIELDPKFAQAYSNRGIIYKAIGENDKALADYSKAIELDPKFARGYNSRGTLYKSLGENDKALADYNKAIELDPKFAQAYSNRGNVYVDLGQKDKALTEYAKAVELDPKLTQAYNSQGVIYADLGQKDKALANYSKAIELDPRNTYAYNNRGIVYQAQGETNKALADFNKAIEIDPKFAPAYRNRGLLYTQLGDLLRSKQDMAKANELARASNR
jgi:tetratricopeptide (TPR) repeat protein